MDGGGFNFFVFHTVFRGSSHREKVWRPGCWRSGIGSEEHGVSHLDGAELSQPIEQHRPDAVCHLAESIQQFPDDAERESAKANIKGVGLDQPLINNAFQAFKSV